MSKDLRVATGGSAVSTNAGRAGRRQGTAPIGKTLSANQGYPDHVELLLIGGGGAGAAAYNPYGCPGCGDEPNWPGFGGGGGGAGGVFSSFYAQTSAGPGAVQQPQTKIGANKTYTIVVGGSNAATTFSGDDISTITADAGAGGGSGPGPGGASGTSTNQASTYSAGGGGYSGMGGYGGAGASSAGNGPSGAVKTYTLSSVVTPTITAGGGGTGAGPGMGGHSAGGSGSYGQGGGGGYPPGQPFAGAPGGAGGVGCFVLRHSDKYPQATTTGTVTVQYGTGFIQYFFTSSGSIRW